jgi:formylglycine-generating enzyme required for sulfatase activity
MKPCFVNGQISRNGSSPSAHASRPQVNAAAFKRKGRDLASLNHREKRLAEAETLAKHAEFGNQICDDERTYLSVCRAAEQSARARARRTKALVSVLVLLLIGAGVGWWKQAALKEKYQWHVMKAAVLMLEQQRALARGQEFRECAHGCPTMVVVPAGSFTMGSPENEEDRSDDEGPQHTVTIGKPFAAGKYDVTFAEWDACVDAGACPRASDSGWGRGDRPVINVSWGDAKLYVTWLKRVTGKDYRLLTEAEWEYAARAGSTTAYWWGDEIGTGNANCDGCGSQWDGKQTSLVGSFKPNAFGLYDMHGNVWQWVEDGYHSGYKGAPNDGSAWIEDVDTSRRVVRGGSWVSLPRLLRAANRFGSNAGFRYFYLGFRLGRTLTP